MCDLSEHFEFEVCSRLIGVIAADFLSELNELKHLVRLSLTGINLSEGARNVRQ